MQIFFLCDGFRRRFGCRLASGANSRHVCGLGFCVGSASISDIHSFFSLHNVAFSAEFVQILHHNLREFPSCEEALRHTSRLWCGFICKARSGLNWKGKYFLYIVFSYPSGFTLVFVSKDGICDSNFIVGSLHCVDRWPQHYDYPAVPGSTLLPKKDEFEGIGYFYEI